jgi:hypothetical protein
MKFIKTIKNIKISFWNNQNKKHKKYCSCCEFGPWEKTGPRPYFRIILGPRPSSRRPGRRTSPRTSPSWATFGPIAGGHSWSFIAADQNPTATRGCSTNKTGVQLLSGNPSPSFHPSPASVARTTAAAAGLVLPAAGDGRRRCDRTTQNNSVLSPKPVHMAIKQ